jgi:AraC-like DNA-binding protein
MTSPLDRESLAFSHGISTDALDVREVASPARVDCSHADQRDWFSRFVDRCQYLAATPSPDTGALLLQAITAVPESCEPPARLLALGLAAHILLTRPATSVAANLQAELRALVAALASSNVAVRDAVDAPLAVRRALDYVSRRFSDPSCRLDVAARTAGVSRWHLAHALKAHTGCAFRGHLRRQRVLAAQHMLVTSSLSIKEIAFGCGYRSATQLCRDFRHVRGSSPGGFRRDAARTLSSRDSTTAVNE